MFDWLLFKRKKEEIAEREEIQNAFPIWTGTCFGKEAPIESVKDVLRSLPIEIRDDLLGAYHEEGQSSLAERYFCEMAKQGANIAEQLQSLYFQAINMKSHILMWNDILCLCQTPLRFLGPMGPILAIAATRNNYLDLQELGVRCFEMWEDKEACRFLEGHEFSEEWLQEYADEVIEYVRKVGGTSGLFEENISWEMAERKDYINSDPL